MSETKLTHLDERGQASMVDVGNKPTTARQAEAEGFVSMQPATLRAIADDALPKGEVLNTARIAAIMAAKRCGDLIPLCHPLPIESVEVHFEVPELAPDHNDPVRLHIRAIAKITAKTGVEMEALTAVSIAGLTIYDMCKAIDKTMVLDGIRLIRKTGGSKKFEAKT
ncbi:MAG TPA: cyclic pyranopterin monophosphate synthase MoaC [Tepidisphaeraceae bacterium]|jgi:cyclic pyranopterin phosphate synthase|nr:cyclic pyranopterin monophosphate synthase MoaC [Tepidisphaeraceae bacterium]